MPANDTLDNIVVKPKRFQCASCQRRFARLEHLQRHERTHTRERPFPCKRCESRFTRSDLLIRHERLSHRSGEASPIHQGLPRTSISQRITKASRPNTSVRANQEPSGDGGPEPTSAPNHRPPGTEHNRSAEDATESSLVTDPETYPPPVLQSPMETSSQMALPSIDVLSRTQCSGAPPLLLDPSQEDFHDELTRFLEADTLESYRISSPGNPEQPYLALTLDHFMDLGDIPSLPEAEPSHLRYSPGELDSLSRFCSRLPTAQPDDLAPRRNLTAGCDWPGSQRTICSVSSEDREYMLRAMVEFAAVIPSLQLPSRLSLARYMRGYVEGFHEHLPFLHIPSMSVQKCSIELLLSMAAVGAQYCFESEKGVSLFRAARAIANERIQRRDAKLTGVFRQEFESGCSASTAGSADSGHPIMNGPLGLPSSADNQNLSSPDHDLIQTAQALLILMAMATWGKHSELLREALAIQSILASIIREDGLCIQPEPDCLSADWQATMRYESVLRTKYIVFCFFNLHCVVYNIPPLILSTELQMTLPCSAAEFRADTAVTWQEARTGSSEPPLFQDAMQCLFSSHDENTSTICSSLANYVLIHAILQHIFLVRQTARCRVDLQASSLADEDMAPLEIALRNWQLRWERSSESSLEPTYARGPVGFNSTALLRLAYVRLNVDTGPSRALGTRDPLQIAHALRGIPAIRRSPKLTRALLHSAHALSIPVKIGIQLIARTQTFVWSIQHSLSSLECALLLSKWFEAVARSENPLTSEEGRILGLVKTMLDETEFAVPQELLPDVSTMARHINIGMLRVWATIFRGPQTWAIVDVVGISLDLYADMLEAAT